MPMVVFFLKQIKCLAKNASYDRYDGHQDAQQYKQNDDIGND